jgi:hypothetical protein
MLGALALAAAVFAVATARDGGTRPTSGSGGSAQGQSTDGKSLPARSAVPAHRISNQGAHRVSRSTAPVSSIGLSGSTLTIPVLGVQAPLVPTGAVGAPDTASLTIPDDVHTVAWWDGTVHDGDRIVEEKAPKPGQPGVALIAGHVDSAAAGPGALYNLRDLKTGDIVEITDSTRTRSSWVVSAPPLTSLKTELPPSLWVTTGVPKLALVSCGGPFDSATGHYLDNVIVWATEATRS